MAQTSPIRSASHSSDTSGYKTSKPSSLAVLSGTEKPFERIDGAVSGDLLGDITEFPARCRRPGQSIADISPRHVELGESSDRQEDPARAVGPQRVPEGRLPHVVGERRGFVRFPPTRQFLVSDSGLAYEQVSARPQVIQWGVLRVEEHQ